MAGERSFKIGRHDAWYEQPGIFAVHWHGEIGPADIRAMYDAIERLAAAGSSVQVLNIVSDAPVIALESRTIAIRDPRMNLMSHMAIVGASFAMRSISVLLQKASALLGKRGGVVVGFCATEAEGLAWLAAQRERGARDASS